MKHSAKRLAFPDFDGDAVIELIKKLVSMDKHWIPSEPGHSLYIRPTMIGTQAALGVGASTDVLLFVICSPVGPYYKTGFKPVSLLATTHDVRAWPGGTGGYKVRHECCHVSAAVC
jgi:branched-chain amino acid aminotransferase